MKLGWNRNETGMNPNWNTWSEPGFGGEGFIHFLQYDFYDLTFITNFVIKFRPLVHFLYLYKKWTNGLKAPVITLIGIVLYTDKSVAYSIFQPWLHERSDRATQRVQCWFLDSNPYSEIIAITKISRFLQLKSLILMFPICIFSFNVLAERMTRWYSGSTEKLFSFDKWIYVKIKVFCVFMRDVIYGAFLVLSNALSA